MFGKIFTCSHNDYIPVLAWRGPVFKDPGIWSVKKCLNQSFPWLHHLLHLIRLLDPGMAATMPQVRTNLYLHATEIKLN